MCSFHSAAVRDRFQAGEVTNLLFNYFKGFNEEVIGSDAEMRGPMVKCGEGEGYLKFLCGSLSTMVPWKLWNTYA